MPTLLAIVSDTHTGSTVGLCPPRAALDDGGEYHPGPQQRRLWGMWREYWQEVARQGAGGEVVACFLGDMVEGDCKDRSTQVITRNKADLIRLASSALEPALEVATRAYFIRGTGAHAGKSGSLEEQLASDCTLAVKTPQGEASWWRLYGEVERVRVLMRHHAPAPGRRPWSKLNPLLTHAYELSLIRPPIALSIAAHNHRCADTGDAYPTRHIALPCWQVMTEYGHRLGLLAPPDIGGLIVRVEGAAYTAQVVAYDQPREAVMKL